MGGGIRARVPGFLRCDSRRRRGRPRRRTAPADQRTEVRPNLALLASRCRGRAHQGDHRMGEVAKPVRRGRLLTATAQPHRSWQSRQRPCSGPGCPYRRGHARRRREDDPRHLRTSSRRATSWRPSGWRRRWWRPADGRTRPVGSRAEGVQDNRSTSTGSRSCIAGSGNSIASGGRLAQEPPSGRAVSDELAPRESARESFGASGTREPWERICDPPNTKPMPLATPAWS
jgi:hypothetical protein